MGFEEVFIFAVSTLEKHQDAVFHAVCTSHDVVHKWYKKRSLLL